MKAYGGMEVWTPALVGREWSASRPGRFTPLERTPGKHYIEGWVGPTAGRENLEKGILLPYRDANSELSVSQPVASRYTDCTIPAPSLYHSYAYEDELHHSFITVSPDLRNTRCSVR
jgi:hypothetical protein